MAGPVGQDLGPGQLEKGSLGPAHCCDGAEVWAFRMLFLAAIVQGLVQPWVQHFAYAGEPGSS